MPKDELLKVEEGGTWNVTAHGADDNQTIINI